MVERWNTMTKKSLSSIAEEYLYSINPLAQRIGEDVTATKEAYEGLWNALSTAEKNQAIDETIIQPEVALKYTPKNVEVSGKRTCEWYPKLRIQTGLRYVIDETGSTLRWRDEHSGPFSFMTQSQMNLNLSDVPQTPESNSSGNYVGETLRFSSPRVRVCSTESSINDYSSTSNRLNFYQSDSYSDSVFKNTNSENILDDCTSNENTGSIFTKLVDETSLPKITDTLVCDDDTESLVSMKDIVVESRSAQKNGQFIKNQMNINFTALTRRNSGERVSESTALLAETPSAYSSFRSSCTNCEDGIPKTGFEFLDNW